jgi:hypothetical protein
MYWMFTGYLTSFYATLAVNAAFTIHSHPRPLQGLAAYFVIIPLLIAAFSAEAVVLAPDEWKTRIRRGFERRSFTRACAFCAGLVTGVGVLVCFAAAYFLYDIAHSGRVAFLEHHESTIFWVGGLALLFILAVAPILPGWWLATRAKRHENAA